MTACVRVRVGMRGGVRVGFMAKVMVTVMALKQPFRVATISQKLMSRDKIWASDLVKVEK